jgi:glutathione S-transferase
VVTVRFKEFGEYSRQLVADAMRWIDNDLADRRNFLAGDVFSIADIVLLCGIDFARFVKMEIPDDAPHLRAWHQRISARPTSRA